MVKRRTAGKYLSHDNRLLNRAQRRIRNSKDLATGSVINFSYVLGIAIITIATIKLTLTFIPLGNQDKNDLKLTAGLELINHHKIRSSVNANVLTKNEKNREIAMVRDRENMGIGVSRGGGSLPVMPAEEIITPHDKAWIDNLNRFLAGSPMAGLGEVFYNEAKKHGIDPRLSPAIARIESGLGSATPGGFNAYGMTAGTVPGHPRRGGWQAFYSWEDAIACHIAFIKSKWGTGAGPFNMKGYATSPAWPAKVNSAMSMIPNLGKEPFGPFIEAKQ